MSSMTLTLTDKSASIKKTGVTRFTCGLACASEHHSDQRAAPMYSRFPDFAARIALVVFGLFLAGNIMAQAPMGELEVRGVAELGQTDGIVTTRVANTTYTWFSGDRIQVSDGTALLTLDAGQSFAFLAGTEASVRTDEERVVIDLDSGMMLYAIEGEDVEVLVNQHRFVNLATPDSELEPCFGLNAAGLLNVIGDDELEVIVQAGILERATVDRAVEHTAQPGERVLFRPDSFEVTEIELPEEIRAQLEDMEDSDELPCIAWWAREEMARGMMAGRAGGVLIGAAIGTGIYQVFFSDDDDAPFDPPDPVSP